MIVTKCSIEYHREAFNKLLDASKKPKQRVFIEKNNDCQQKIKA